MTTNFEVQSHFEGQALEQGDSNIWNKRTVTSGNSFVRNGRNVDAEAMVTSFATDRYPGINTKRSKIAFAVTVMTLSFLSFFCWLEYPTESLDSQRLVVRKSRRT